MTACTAVALHADNVNYLALVQGVTPGGFQGPFSPNQTTASDSFTNTGTNSSSAWSGSANLAAGTLRATASASTDGSVGTFSNTVIVGFGDTILTTGTSADPFRISFHLTGSMSSTGPSGAYINSASFGAYFLQPGSFDHGYAAQGNRISSPIYGIGPNWVNLFGIFPPLNGIVNVGQTVSFRAPVGLPSGFQVIVFLQPYGTLNSGGPSSFLQDLGNTLQVSLTAPVGVTATSLGGLPVSTASAVPEPGTWAGTAAGLIAILALRRRR